MWVSQTLIPHCMQRVIHCQPTKFAQSTTAHSWTFRENGYQGAWESACHPTTHCDTPSSYCRPHITQFSCIQASSCISQDAFHVIFVMTNQQFALHILQHGWGSMNPAVHQMNFGNLMLVANASPSVGDLLLSKLGALKNKLPTIFYSRLVISECIDSVFFAGGDSQHPLCSNMAECVSDIQDQNIKCCLWQDQWSCSWRIGLK